MVIKTKGAAPAPFFYHLFGLKINADSRENSFELVCNIKFRH
jgi:hypothetical protein